MPTENEPFGRQPQPVTVMLKGYQLDIDKMLPEFIRFAERSGGTISRNGNTFTIYPRAVND